MADVSPWSLLSPFQQTFEKFWNVPITNWGRFFNPQVVFNYNPDDIGIESHVLGRVGSYGSQLSTLIDAVNVMRERLDATSLDPGQRVAIERFDRLRVDSERAVSEYRGTDPEDLIRRLAELHAHDATAFATVRQAVLALGDGSDVPAP
jgi:hypothetical protein